MAAPEFLWREIFPLCQSGAVSIRGRKAIPLSWLYWWATDSRFYRNLLRVSIRYCLENPHYSMTRYYWSSECQFPLGDSLKNRETLKIKKNWNKLTWLYYPLQVLVNFFSNCLRFFTLVVWFFWFSFTSWNFDIWLVLCISFLCPLLVLTLAFFISCCYP